MKIQNVFLVYIFTYSEKEQEKFFSQENKAVNTVSRKKQISNSCIHPILSGEYIFLFLFLSMSNVVRKWILKNTP